MVNQILLGAVAGDVIGSVFEWNNIRSKNFPLFSPRSDFTDDTVLTIAVADALVNNRDMAVTIKQYARSYPHRGYGGRFSDWVESESLEPYNSFGNGSAMRVSAAGAIARSLEEALALAKMSAEVTHNHPEGIKGAQAVAAAIFMGRNQSTKNSTRIYISEKFGYDLTRTLDEIRPGYRFDETCQGSVPEAIIAFLESVDFEDAIRTAISLGGDSDTIACITGSIAAAFYGNVPEEIAKQVLSLLPGEFIEILKQIEGENCGLSI